MKNEDSSLPAAAGSHPPCKTVQRVWLRGPLSKRASKKIILVAEPWAVVGDVVNLNGGMVVTRVQFDEGFSISFPQVASADATPQAGKE